MSLNPGILRHKVTLQASVKTPDGFGGHTEAWTDVATVHASVEPLEGYERIQAMQTQAGVTHRVRIRYRAGVTATMRLLYAGRVLELVAPPIDPDERHRELLLLCKEVS